MKHRNMGYMAALIVFASAAWCQGKQTAKDTISVGVELQLGLPRDAVMSRLAEGYKLVRVGTGDDWFVESKDEQGVNYGQVSFSSGKLSLAEKTWTGGGEDDFSFAQTLHGALEQFGKEGRHVCNVKTDISRTPSAEMRSVTLSCGAKSLVIQTTEVLSGENKGKFTSIQELLMSAQSDH